MQSVFARAGKSLPTLEVIIAVKYCSRVLVMVSVMVMVGGRLGVPAHALPNTLTFERSWSKSPPALFFIFIVSFFKQDISKKLAPTAPSAAARAAMVDEDLVAFAAAGSPYLE